MIITCNHCSQQQTYYGERSVTNCKKCGYKIFIKPAPPAPQSFNQGKDKITYNFQTTEDHIRIIPWGDIHVGAPKGQCDWQKAQNELQYILDTPNTYLLGMGDYMDCAQRMPQKGPNLFVSSLMPMEQFSLLEKALKPLAEKGKILGLLTGNHENWIMEATGIQIIDLLCRSLKVPYLGYASEVNINVNKQSYYIYALHGKSGATRKHTKMAALVDCASDIFADVFVMGHVHQVDVTKGGKYMRGKTSKAYYVLSGHFLNWIGSYAQAFGMGVCPSGCPKISLFSSHKDVHVSV